MSNGLLAASAVGDPRTRMRASWTTVAAADRCDAICEPETPTGRASELRSHHITSGGHGTNAQCRKAEAETDRDRQLNGNEACGRLLNRLTSHAVPKASSIATTRFCETESWTEFPLLFFCPRSHSS